MIKRFTIFCLAFAASACASSHRAPLPSITTDVPNVWSGTIPTGATAPAPRQPTSLVAWWERFHDPLLTGLVLDALRTNTSVQIALSAIEQARSLQDVAQAGLVPSVLGSANASRTTRGIASNNSVTSSNYSAGLDGTWTLDVYGRRQSAFSERQAVVWARVADLGDMQVQVSSELASQYIALRAAQTRLAIARTNLISQTNTRQIANWRKQAGLASALETEQAGGAVAQIQASIPKLEQTIDVSILAIAVLSGRTPAALNGVLRPTRDVPRAGSDLVLAIPAETLRQRADVRAREYVILEAMGRLGQADAATKPSFTLGGSLSLSSGKLATFLNGSSILSALSAGVTLPLFDGGASKSQVGAQEAALEQARQSYRATVLTALRQVEDNLVILDNDTKSLFALDGASRAATRAANLARVQYRGGLISFQIVLETQRAELASQDALASAKATISTDQIALYKSLGGGWAAPALLPTPPESGVQRP